jgi:hypothetical protein
MKTKKEYFTLHKLRRKIKKDMKVTKYVGSYDNNRKYKN